MSNLITIVSYAVKNGASDIHLTVGSPPACRIDGAIRFMKSEVLKPSDTVGFLDELMNERQKKRFMRTGDADLSYGFPGLGRFRVNIMRQRGSIGIVMRHVKGKILKFQELHLPPAMNTIADFRRGLVLITGTTGSGKSTTLAAIIDWINRHRSDHIITLEDPIEFLHNNIKSIVTQREIHIDTMDFKKALRAAMREDPDVILIGEMRDQDTFEAAISGAETGHLVFSTLHTTNVMMTIDRILDMFPQVMHQQVRNQLSMHLKACVAQRLIPAADGKGRVPAIEIMLSNPGIASLIRENNIRQIPNAIMGGKEDGMQTFNLSLHASLKEKLITLEDAIVASDNPEELNMLMQGIQLSAMSRGGILKK